MEASKRAIAQRVVGWAVWLAAGASAAFASLLWSFAALYAPDAPIPWWTPWVAVACAFESAAAQAAVERMNLPRVARVAEGAVLLGAVYFAAGGGGLFPGSNVAEWVATRSGGSALAVLIAGLSWGWSALLAARLAGLGPSTAYDLASRRIGAAVYVERRLFASLLLVLLLVAVAEIEFPGRLAAPASAPFRAALAAGVAVLLACGLLLLGLLSLLRAQSVWEAEGIPVSRRLPQEWIRGAAYTVAVAVGFALLLPGGWALLSLDRLLELFSLAASRLVMGITYGFFTGMRGAGQSVQPRSPSPLDRPAAGSLPPNAGSGGDGAVMAIQILFALLAVAALAFGVLLLVTRFSSLFKEERERLPSLRELPRRFARWLWSVLIRLAGLFRRSFELVRGTVSALGRALGQSRRKRAGREEEDEEAPSAPALFVRYLFRKLLAAAAREGFRRRRGETALEFGRRLKAEVEGAASSVDHLVEAYAKARYSRSALSEAAKEPARAAWRRVVAALRARPR